VKGPVRAEAARSEVHRRQEDEDDAKHRGEVAEEAAMATQEPFVSFKRDALRAHAASSHRPWLGVSCLYEDLRALPYRASYFDAVACISTLEHVGMDNRLYGSDLPPAAEPQREAARALDELVRVLAPGGTLFLTVPYGAAEDHGWFRQYDREAGITLGEVRGLTLEALSVFRYTAAGWRRSDLDDAADATYRDYQQSPELVADRAAAARAVACMRFMRVAASPEPSLSA
jgi:SAM-dependent methyltransferase